MSILDYKQMNRGQLLRRVALMENENELRKENARLTAENYELKQTLKIKENMDSNQRRKLWLWDQFEALIKEIQE